jgi:hypothetical protein
VTSQQLTVFDRDGAQVLDKAIVKRPAELMGVAFVAGGQLVVLTTEEVRLVDAAGRTRHRVPLRQGRSVQPFREGTLVIVGTIATYGIEVFEVAGKQLVRRFRDRIAWQNNYPAGGRYLVHANTGHWFELLTA